uniref:Uncharacterized protein n=2 Tax=unclassified Caudoviricetes TaxID=2788787 RepID=A0A8S5VBG9_9CAUD|nr:MAG TPA: hypothetical protein [Siphoviridae sp. ctfrT39]DAG03951.1 MAG TPA: hypothetical protein [Siphoviridae sp. ct0vA12]
MFLFYVCKGNTFICFAQIFFAKSSCFPLFLTFSYK